MKKIYSIALAAVAILSAASCQKELVNDNFDAAGEKFTVTAVASADSKTVLDGNTSYWTPGDKITVFNAEGQPVAFDTDITEKAASAKFTNTTEFTAPTSLVAVYPDRDGNQLYKNGIITNFRVGGTQTAVAGSFDPTMAGAVGTPKAEGSTELVFNNIHCLVKFTVGGDSAPTSVKLINNSGTMIAGLYKYDLANNAVINEGAASAVTLTGSFEVGQTYYIAAIPYDVKTTLTLQFDGEDVKTSGEVTLEPNKIYNLGTVAKPAAGEEPVVSAIDVTRVWGHYGVDGMAWSNSVVASLDGADRSLAMDDKYIYIPETNTSGNIHKFNVADGTYAGTLPASADMNLGTHYVSCIRTVKNSNGDDILLVSNLSLGEGLRIFAYVNGTDAEPVTMTTISNGRRWGDKFTVTGTWENGKMWFRSYDSRGMVGFVPLSGENTTWSWVEAHPVDNGNAIDADNISEVTWVPGTEGFCLLNTNSDLGAHVMSGTSGAYTEVKSYPTLAKTFGYNFFEVGDNKFIAWTSLVYGKESPRLQIVQSDATTVEKMVETFDNLYTRLVFEAPLQNADDMTVPGVGGGHTVCDCCVREINGELYIAAIAQKAGLSLFKVTAK